MFLFLMQRYKDIFNCASIFLTFLLKNEEKQHFFLSYHKLVLNLQSQSLQFI